MTEMRKGFYTRKLSLFPNHSIGFNKGGRIEGKFLGKTRPALCPLCYSEIVGWHNWYASKEWEQDLYGECENKHTINERDIVVKIFTDEIDDVLKSELKARG
jgi:hypothetical protein